CPKCGAAAIRRFGVGTERVEEALAARFPSARVARLDRDTAGGRGLARVLGAGARREGGILVGTQMGTQGHDFPGVTLVGVLLADAALSLPDFRASERTFQLLTQVAGRAGRGDRPGRVIVQTYAPDHHAVACARTHDYAAFYAAESAVRGELGYPPPGPRLALRPHGEGGTRPPPPPPPPPRRPPPPRGPAAPSPSSAPPRPRSSGSAAAAAGISGPSTRIAPSSAPSCGASSTETTTGTTASRDRSASRWTSIPSPRCSTIRRWPCP